AKALDGIYREFKEEKPPEIYEYYHLQIFEIKHSFYQGHDFIDECTKIYLQNDRGDCFYTEPYYSEIHGQYYPYITICAKTKEKLIEQLNEILFKFYLDAINVQDYFSKDLKKLKLYNQLEGIWISNQWLSEHNDKFVYSARFPCEDGSISILNEYKFITFDFEEKTAKLHKKV